MKEAVIKLAADSQERYERRQAFKASLQQRAANRSVPPASEQNGKTEKGSSAQKPQSRLPKAA